MGQHVGRIPAGKCVGGQGQVTRAGQAQVKTGNLQSSSSQSQTVGKKECKVGTGNKAPE